MNLVGNPYASPLFESTTSFNRVVYLFHFIKDTGIVPLYLLSGSGMPTHATTSGRQVSMRDLAQHVSSSNRGIVLLVLMCNLLCKIAVQFYRR